MRVLRLQVVPMIKQTPRRDGRPSVPTAAGRPAQGGRLVPMRVSDGVKAFVLDQLQALGGVVARSMFGGVGLYCDGVFFGIIASDVLYLKADEVNRPEYELAGASPFRPYADRASTMKYYAVPVDVLESEPDLLEWARKAVAAAERAAATTLSRRQPPRRRRSPRRRARR